jgi:hypothetical protein
MYRNLKLKPLLTPTPGTGGRSRTELGQRHLQVLAACDGLLKALEAAAPTDFDCGSGPDEKVAMARDAWHERTALIQGLRSEFELETMKIAIGWGGGTTSSRDNDRDTEALDHAIGHAPDKVCAVEEATDPQEFLHVPEIA